MKRRRQQDSTVMLVVSVCAAVAAVAFIWFLFDVYVDKPLEKAYDDSVRNAEEGKEIMRNLNRELRKIQREADEAERRAREEN